MGDVVKKHNINRREDCDSEGKWIFWGRLRLILGTVILLMAIGALSGCLPTDKEDNAPDEVLILDDLQRVLTEYQVDNQSYDLTISDISIMQSLTEEKLYTAQIDVVAESKYADRYYSAKVAYTKYDQGWMMDDCVLDYMSYAVVRYPEKEEMKQFAVDSGIKDVTGGEFICDGDTIEYAVEGVADWSAYAYVEGTVTSRWKYDEYDDAWEFENQLTTYDDVRLNKSIEGTLDLYDIEDAYVTDIFENGFNIRINSLYYTIDTTKVYLEQARIVYEDAERIMLLFENSSIEFKTTSQIAGADNKNKTLRGEISVLLCLYKDTRTNQAGVDYNAEWTVTVHDNRYNVYLVSYAYTCE